MGRSGGGRSQDKQIKLGSVLDKSNFSKCCRAAWEAWWRQRMVQSAPQTSPALPPLITFPVLLQLAFPRSWPFR